MAKKASSGSIIHFGAISFRVVGDGELFSTLRSLQNSDNSILSLLTMNTITDREPTVLSNFSKQRAQLDLRVLNIDETFTVSKIIFWTKPVATGYPQ